VVGDSKTTCAGPVTGRHQLCSYRESARRVGPGRRRRRRQLRSAGSHHSPDSDPEPRLPSQPDSDPEPRLPSQPDSDPEPRQPSQPDSDPEPRLPSQPDSDPEPRQPSQPDSDPEPRLPSQPDSAPGRVSRTRILSRDCRVSPTRLRSRVSLTRIFLFLFVSHSRSTRRAGKECNPQSFSEARTAVVVLADSSRCQELGARLGLQTCCWGKPGLKGANRPYLLLALIAGCTSCVAIFC